MAAREEWQPFGSVGHPINMLRNRIMAPNRENNKSRMWLEEFFPLIEAFKFLNSTVECRHLQGF